MPGNEKLYTIGKAAELCSVNAKTLRYYDEIGLVSPGYKDPSSGYRYYTQEQLYTIFMVRKFKNMGFSLKEIQEMLEDGDISSLTAKISGKLAEISKKIDQLEIMQTEGFFLLERLNAGKDSLALIDSDKEVDQADAHLVPGRVRVETLKRVDVIHTRGVKTNYQVLDISVDRWVELYAIAASLKLIPVGGIILTYHNPPLEQFLKNTCDLEVSLPVIKQDEAPERIKTFGGFKAATIIHSSDYKDIINTHITILKWVNDNGYKVNGLVSEEYIISPFDTANVDTYLTKIIVPIASP